ncbi:DUF3500 domain-containing protein [Loktanella sp. D2R18]|uniref:DUF3500 domain-containing protein n=2 Tax=Rhodobacterales TaxID=204455 RepID=UPI00215DBC3A|nr:DUF3500 domain-containing protein [Loktanella sp. D2R18]
MQEREAFAALLRSLSDEQREAALNVTELSADQQVLLLAAVETYVGDLNESDAAAYMAQYTAELSETVLGYSGTTEVNTEDDYVRIHGPTLWQEIPATHVAVITRYFAQHLQFQNGDGTFSPTLADVAIETAQNDHVGRYALLTLQYQFPASTSPLYLTYDAIMHEVRNQRAAVYWQESGSDPRIIEEFGYRPLDGMQQPIQLEFLSR